MGAEFIPVMSDENGFYNQTEYSVTRMVPGDPESVRTGLLDALEESGFRVLSESPIQTRRQGTESGAAGCSNDILTYPATLAVALKPVGKGSTQATFDYVVRNPVGYLTEGDGTTLTREVEALIAIANARRETGRCLSCGGEFSGGTRFCRQCGAPAAVAEPVEVDLLKLTAQTNVGYKWAAWGTGFVVLALVLPAILFFANPDAVRFAKLVRVITFLTATMGVSGVLMLLRGLWWMGQALKPRPEPALPRVSRRATAAVPDTASLTGPAALPPALDSPAAIPSVTEATTDLLRKDVNAQG